MADEKNTPGKRHGNRREAYYATDPKENPELQSSLKGQHAIVTGSGRGIGREIALFLTHASAKALTLVALDQPEIEETAVLCKKINPDIQILTKTMDVTNQLEVQDVVQEAAEKFGTIDVLVCNAGRPGQFLRTEESDPGIWWSTVGTSVQHSFLFTRYALPYMQGRKSGRIIYTTSSAANFSGGLSGYVIGKLGQVRLAEIIHVENYRENNIKCFAFSPGGVKTRFFYAQEEGATGAGHPEGSVEWKDRDVPGQAKSAAVAYSILKDLDFDQPTLAAGLVTALAAGKLDFMSGRYLDATVDIDEYIKSADEITSKDLNRVRLHRQNNVFEPEVGF